MIRPIIKSQLKFFLAINIFIIAIFFIITGITAINLSEIFQQYYKIQNDYVANDMVHFLDPSPHISDMTYLSIDKTDDSPLEIGKPIRLHAYITSNELPKELVVHIYNQDMNDFFVGNSSSDYRSLAHQLNRVPTMRIGDAWNIQFDLSIMKNQDHYDLNGFQTMTFTTPGIYFAQVSIKSNSTNTIEHYKSPYVVMTIRDSQSDWTVQSMEKIIHSMEGQKSDSMRTFGWGFVATGMSMLFAGINILFSSVEGIKKESEVKVNRDIISRIGLQNNIKLSSTGQPIGAVNEVNNYSNKGHVDSHGTVW